MAGITAKNKNKVLEPKLASSTLFNNSNLSSHMETLPNQPTTMLDKFIEALLMSPNTYLLGFSMQPRCVTAFVGLREGGTYPGLGVGGHIHLTWIPLVICP